MPEVYNGIVVLQVKDVYLSDEEELTKALTWLMPSIAKEISKSASQARPRIDVGVSGTSGPQGSSGTVTVSGNVGGGVVSGSVTAGPGGTSGTVTGTFHF